MVVLFFLCSEVDEQDFLQKILFANQREALVPKDAQERVRYPPRVFFLLYKQRVYVKIKNASATLHYHARS